MDGYLLDTNHLSAVINRISPVRNRIQNEIRNGVRIGTCIPVICELEAAIEQKKRPASCRQTLVRLLQVVRIWPVDRGVARQMWLKVVFGVYCGTHKLSCCVDGYPQESIRRPPHNYSWSGFSDVFYFDCGYIVDWKFMQSLDQQEWEALPVGAVIDDFCQQNRMKIKDCHGIEHYFHFTERHFRKIKSGPGTWHLVVVQ